MLRKIVCLFAASCMVLAVGLPAVAAEDSGTVRVVPVWGGKPVTGGTIQLFRVGSVVTEGFQLTDGLANWIVGEEEVHSRTVLNWLRDNVKEGLYRTAGENGALFTGLEEGLYLVTQQEAAEGYRAFAHFLVQLPEGDAWEVTVRPNAIREGESPQTGDRPAPIIGAMGLGLSAAVLMVLADERKK